MRIFIHSRHACIEFRAVRETQALCKHAHKHRRTCEETSPRPPRIGKTDKTRRRRSSLRPLSGYIFTRRTPNDILSNLYIRSYDVRCIPLALACAFCNREICRKLPSACVRATTININIGGGSSSTSTRQKESPPQQQQHPFQ